MSALLGFHWLSTISAVKLPFLDVSPSVNPWPASLSSETQSMCNYFNSWENNSGSLIPPNPLGKDCIIWIDIMWFADILRSLLLRVSLSS